MVFLSKAVEQRAYFAVASFGSSLVGHLAEVADSVAGRLGIVAVAQAAGCCLANALLRRIVVCHEYANSSLVGLYFDW